VTRIRRQSHILLASTIVAVVLLATGVAFARDAARGRRLAQTRATLVASQAQATARKQQIDLRLRQVKKLRAQLASTASRAKSLDGKLRVANTRVSGLKGSLDAAAHDKETLRACFRAIIDAGEAANRGDQAALNAAADRAEAPCRASERLI
jgi:septal ring factor EnvC (AmiA/AmiB activator)